MKILFLDDDSHRHDTFEDYVQGLGHSTTHVFSAKSAITALERSGPFDIAFLDHDLGDTVFAPSDENSGYEVAKWIVQHPECIEDSVVVHSYNPAGAKNMVNALLDQPFDVTHAPFDPSLKKWLVEEGKR